jgi:hypothetical protein
MPEFCKDCQHYEFNDLIDFPADKSKVHKHQCNFWVKEKFDLVTGESMGMQYGKARNCHTARSDETDCGPHGAYFLAKRVVYNMSDLSVDDVELITKNLPIDVLAIALTDLGMDPEPEIFLGKVTDPKMKERIEVQIAHAATYCTSRSVVDHYRELFWITVKGLERLGKIGPLSKA